MSIKFLFGMNFSNIYESFKEFKQNISLRFYSNFLEINLVYFLVV